MSTRKLQQALQSARRSASSDEPYCPDTGDFITINFDPQAGREQAGARPAIVLSPRAYNQKARLCVLCPITSQVKGFPFEVVIPPGLPIAGAVLSDHIKSLSWEARGARFAGKAPPAVHLETLGKIKALLGF